MKIKKLTSILTFDWFIFDTFFVSFVDLITGAAFFFFFLEIYFVIFLAAGFYGTETATLSAGADLANRPNLDYLETFGPVFEI